MAGSVPHAAAAGTAGLATYVSATTLDVPALQVTGGELSVEAELTKLPDDLRVLAAPDAIRRWQGAGGELKLVRLEEMVRKMTALPCQRLGLFDRGLIRPGMAADLVCFDAERVRDTATYEQPRAYPEGIPYVLVNGVAGDLKTATQSDKITIRVSIPVSQIGWITPIFLPGQAIESESLVMMRQR